MPRRPTDPAERRTRWRTARRRRRHRLNRYRYPVVERSLGTRRAAALFAFLNGALAIGMVAVIAHLADAPLIFPSLGPTAYLVFAQPLAAASSPRNALAGHAIGALAGLGSVLLFGLSGEPHVLEGGVTWARVGAAALSLGATSGAMILLHAHHPPAGATTLIVSLGMMSGPGEVAALMVAVSLLILQAWAINRMAGILYPTWSARPSPPRARAPHPDR